MIMQYSHNKEKLDNDKQRECTLCNKIGELIKLPDNFQEHAAKKGFVSYFCCSCIQIVNFLNR